MEVASFRASQFYEIASFGIGSNCKILSLLLEGHYHHYPFFETSMYLQCTILYNRP